MSSLRHRPVPLLRRAARRTGLAVGVVAVVIALGAVSPALGAQRLESFDLPSSAGNVDIHVAPLNKATSLRAYALLPDGYDSNPDKRWPVLYLLHGVDDDASAWSNDDQGDLLDRAISFPGIVVMPEGGRGWYTDAWAGGTRTGENWEQYLLDEVVPGVESRYRIASGRANHAIGGLSMGGYGAVLLAAELPSYFGTAITMSGLLNTQNPFSAILVPYSANFSYTHVWGPYSGPYSKAHDPMTLIPNLAGTRLYVATGNGIPEANIPYTQKQLLIGGPAEAAARVDAIAFTTSVRKAGLDVTLSAHLGLHSWSYWEPELNRLLAWGPFGSADGTSTASPTAFTYTSMAPRGNAWGLGYRFATPPTALLTLTRNGQTVTATGSGTLTISPGAADADASGGGTKPACTFTAKLPFTRTLPVGC